MPSGFDQGAGVRQEETALDSFSLDRQQVQRADVLHELEKQRDYPPGNDPHISACYGAVLDFTTTDNDVNLLMNDVLARRDITANHFVNLLLRSVQYVELFQKENPSYPAAFVTSAAWKQELPRVVAEHGAELRRMLLEKDTTTTIYQRYAGASALMGALLPSRPLAVADFGCGGNYGLPGIASKERFQPLRTDETPDTRVSALLHHPPRIGSGLSIDRENPYVEDVRMWRLACSFYPQELGQMGEVVALEDRLRQVPGMTFVQADLLAMQVPEEERQKYDAIIMSTMCYQMPHAQEGMLHTAAQMLSKDGIVIIQDFARKDPTTPDLLDFDVNWGMPYTYRSFVTGPRTKWEMRELLQWGNGRCREVRPGEDFDLLSPSSTDLEPAA